MAAESLYLEAVKRGLRLEARGDRLAVMPASSVPPDMAAALKLHKAELLALLAGKPGHRWQAVPPINMALNATCPTPALTERELMIAYNVAQRHLTYVSAVEVPVPSPVNARPEWRGTERIEMQTGHAIPRPLQADC